MSVLVPTIELAWDSRDLEVWRGRKVDQALLRATKLAGNRALRKMQKDSISTITSRKRMRSSDVMAGLPLVFPSRKEALQDLVWTQKVSGKPVPLSRFPHIATKSGVSVRVNVRSATKRIKSAFVLTLRSGHTGIFQRKGKSRLPIRQLWTTRISDVMQDPGTIPTIQQHAHSEMESAFRKGLERELAKLRKKGEI